LLSFETGANSLDGVAGENLQRATATEKLRFVSSLVFRGSRLTAEERERGANMVVLSVLVVLSLTQLSSSNYDAPIV
jgi:hypothetical protein